MNGEGCGWVSDKDGIQSGRLKKVPWWETCKRHPGKLYFFLVCGLLVTKWISYFGYSSMDVSVARFTEDYMKRAGRWKHSAAYFRWRKVGWTAWNSQQCSIKQHTVMGRAISFSISVVRSSLHSAFSQSQSHSSCHKMTTKANSLWCELIRCSRLIIWKISSCTFSVMWAFKICESWNTTVIY